MAKTKQKYEMIGKDLVDTALKIVFQKHPEITNKNLVNVKMSESFYYGDTYIQQDYEVEYNQRVIDHFNIIVDYNEDKIGVTLNF